MVVGRLRWMAVPVLLLVTMACSVTDSLTAQANSETGPGYYDDSDQLKTTVKDKLLVGGPAGAGDLQTYFDANNWTFDGTAGQTVTITVAAVKGSDPHVKLLQPDGTLLAEDDDGGGGTNAQLVVVLPIGGTYTIRVDMMTLGEYTVGVR